MKNKLTAEEKYTPMPLNDEELTIENIVRQWPKTNDCELQTLEELRNWQIEKLNELVCKAMKELVNKNEKLKSELLFIDINVLPEKDREYEELKKGNEKLKSQIDELVQGIKDIYSEFPDNPHIALSIIVKEKLEQLLQKHKTDGKELAGN